MNINTVINFKLLISQPPLQLTFQPLPQKDDKTSRWGVKNKRVEERAMKDEVKEEIHANKNIEFVEVLKKHLNVFFQIFLLNIKILSQRDHGEEGEAV